MLIRSLTYYMQQFWLPIGVRIAGHMMIPTVPFKEAYFFRRCVEIPGSGEVTSRVCGRIGFGKR